MKINSKSIMITVLLCAVLCFVIVCEIAIFISGPSYKYDDKIDKQIALIKEDAPDIIHIKRHVFQYITYVGETNNAYVWYNEEGEKIVSREISTYKENNVLEKAKSDYGIQQPEITLGYGYNNPVYVVEQDGITILYDYDTLEEVYYFKLGDE